MQPTAEAAIIAPQLHELALFDRLAQDPDYIPSMAEKGKPEVDRRNAIVLETVKTAVMGKVGGYEVPIVHAPHHYSWVGHALLEAFPEAPFSVTYRSSKDGYLLFNLRSRWNWRDYSGFNCRRLAQQFGGGGHRPAAGFTLQQVKTLQAGDRFFFATTPGCDPRKVGVQRSGFNRPRDIYQVGEDGWVYNTSADNWAVSELNDDLVCNEWVIRLKG
jgi:hypothetical protein